MGGDRAVDLEGDGEGSAAIVAGDQWGGAGADGVQEGRDFEAEGFAQLDLDLLQGEARRRGAGLRTVSICWAI